MIKEASQQTTKLNQLENALQAKGKAKEDIIFQFIYKNLKILIKELCNHHNQL